MSKQKTEAELDEALGFVGIKRIPHRPLQPWSWDDLENEPDTGWLVGDDDHPILIEDGLWLIFGLYKSGKTYFAMEQAFCVAFGLSFHGQPVKQCDVAYVIAEGGRKRMQRRFQAIFDKHAEAMGGRGFSDARAALNSGHFHLVANDVNIVDADADQGTSELIKELQAFGPVGVVYLDTWASMLAKGGSHVSDQSGVPDAIQNCKVIRETLRTTLVIVAHVPVAKENQDRPSGLGDLSGQIDGGTKAEKEGDGAEAWFHFRAVIQRFAEDGFTIRAQMENIGSDVALANRDGEDYTTSKLTDGEAKALDALKSMGGSLVGLDIWRDAVKATGLWAYTPQGEETTNDAWRVRWHRLKAKLIKGGHVTEHDGRFSIAGDPAADFPEGE